MNQRGTTILLRFTTCVPALLLLIVGLSARAQNTFPEGLLLRLTPGASIASLAQDYGLAVVDGVPDRGVFEVSAEDQGSAFATQYFLNSDSRVIYCESEADVGIYEVHGTPFHLAFEKSANSAAYNNQKAYNQIDSGISGSTSNSITSGQGAAVSPVTVAILDTGVDLTHPALTGALLDGFNALNPGSAPLDIPDGWNNQVVGHGTMVAGIVARISPNSIIMPVRVLNADGIGRMISVIKGIHYAVTNGAQVINMSFETRRNSIALADAMDEATTAGIVLVASAGNDSVSRPRYPAAYSNVIGVASVEDDNTLSNFSNFGINATLVAPGGRIRSTYWNDEYATWAGTSFAAPFVTAEAAEVLARNQNWSPAQVTYIMLITANSVDYLNPRYANMLGAGIIDLQAAIGGE